MINKNYIFCGENLAIGDLLSSNGARIGYDPSDECEVVIIDFNQSCLPIVKFTKVNEYSDNKVGDITVLENTTWRKKESKLKFYIFYNPFNDKVYITKEPKEHDTLILVDIREYTASQLKCDCRIKLESLS